MTKREAYPETEPATERKTWNLEPGTLNSRHSAAALCLGIEIRPDFFHHLAEIHPELLQRGPADVPIAAIKTVHRQIRQQTECVWDSCDAARFRRLGHIEKLNHLALVIAQERKIRAETGPEAAPHLGPIDAH